MFEDRPCESVESQEVIVRSEQVLISGLNPEISRRTTRERLRVFVEPRDVEETGNTRINLRDYNILL